jgi:hypothetical protein
MLAFMITAKANLRSKLSPVGAAEATTGKGEVCMDMQTIFLA